MGSAHEERPTRLGRAPFPCLPPMGRAATPQPPPRPQARTLLELGSSYLLGLEGLPEETRQAWQEVL